MIEHVWLLADATTGDVSYVHHGLEGDQANWKTIGPFAYTQQEAAEEAAENPQLFPEGMVVELNPIAVSTSALVQAIFNGFPPSNTDVFMLDEGLFPLTNGGADWVDEAIGVPVWGPLFDEGGRGTGLRWLDKVLCQVAARLDMKMETVQAIGYLNAAAEDEAAAAIEQTVLLVQKHVRVAIIPEPGTLALEEHDDHHVLSAAARFWLHTNGMGLFGLPELEIRNVPCWWVAAAGAELKDWACYSLDHGIIEGAYLDGKGPVPLKLRAVLSPDEFWQQENRECLRLEVDKVTFSSGHLRHGHDGPRSVH